MKTYSLTKTLDEFVDFYIDDPKEAEVIIVGGSKIDLTLYPKLKYIFKCGVGVDNIPFDKLGDKIKLVLPSDKTREAIYDEVSTFAVYSILSSNYRNTSNTEEWEKAQRISLKDKIVLVVGAKGNIGKRVVEKLIPLFSTVLEYDIDSDIPLDELLPTVDIVTFHCPLTDSNKGMVDMRRLKSNIIIVNTARGALFDEEELYNFLINNDDAVASFDVFWEEPYKGKLLKLNNFIATPHIASSSDGFVKGLYDDLKFLIG